MMEQTMPNLDYINRLLDDLKRDIKRDTFNLARDDQDVIELKIDKLKKFIEERYAERARKTNAM